LGAVKLAKAVMAELTVRPGQPAGLHERSTKATSATWLGSDQKKYKTVAEKDLRVFVDELTEAQRLLWASNTHALLIVLQAMDAAGKDGTIRHVMSGVNPQGCKVEAFKQPSSQELSHDFLWRSSKALPERGMIGIFNRSYYEEVLVARVHPELLARGTDGTEERDSVQVWRDRFEDINTFERHLDRNGTKIVKIFLHVSREQQKKRLLERIDDPDKNWKFSLADLAERKHWDAYLAAYEEALSATSTPWAPWRVVPADHKYALRALVGAIIVDAIDDLDLRMPRPGADDQASFAKAKAELLDEAP
jgi:PPK2 family polyphosphate:nucleotide phosphotransferase